MKKQFLGAVMALAMTPLAAQAGEPVKLTDGQMDQVSAGLSLSDIGPIVSAAVTVAALQADGSNTVVIDTQGVFGTPGADFPASTFNAPGVTVSDPNTGDPIGSVSNTPTINNFIVSPQLVLVPNDGSPSQTLPGIQYGTTNPDLAIALGQLNAVFNGF